jgi:SAM-dependent methyltransferase
VSSSSPAAELVAYGGERIVTPRIALLIALIAGLGFAAEPPHDGISAALRIGLAALLVVQFRLWDDLADRAYDRRHHPERVLVARKRTDAPYLATLGAMAVGIVALLAAQGQALWRVAAYVGLALLLALVYRIGESARRLRSQGVLLKYPVFVLLPLAAPFTRGALVYAALAYAVVTLYDHVTTPRVTLQPARTALAAPRPDMFEPVACYACGSRESSPLVAAEEDLTGKPGRFTFVTCAVCGLAYQSPRLKLEHIGAYYDDEYIAHRKQTDWGWLTPLYTWTMDKHDRDKAKIVARYARLDSAAEVLDVGCGAGTFVAKIRKLFGARVSAVDFKDLSALPWLQNVDFRCGLFYEQQFGAKRFDLITMWHFLEHDYDAPRTLATARDLLGPEGRLVIEVPRLDSLTWRLYHERWPGLQAPQHTLLFDGDSLQALVRAADLEIVDYLPYGAFPPYFYVFAGAAFKLLKGRGLDLRRAIVPYFLGQLLLAPVLIFERRLNLAMQTVVCQRKSASAA